MYISNKLTIWMTTHEEIFTPGPVMKTAANPDVDSVIAAHVGTGSR